MSEMVQRVAEAIDPLVWESEGDYPADRRRIAEWRAESLVKARAALEAMREPTQEMIDAGVTADRGATLGAMFANAHRASIDAALGQEGTEG